MPGPQPSETADARALHATILLLADEPQAGLVSALEASTIRQERLPAEHWQVAEAASLCGESLVALGRLHEAESLLVESHALLLAQRGADDRSTRAAARRLVELYERLGQPDVARRYQDGS
jgi:hypothetical protein